MIDATALPVGVLKDVAKNLGWGEDDFSEDFKQGRVPVPEEYVRQISELSVDEIFQRWCDWHGLIGWSGSIAMALDGIREAEV